MKRIVSSVAVVAASFWLTSASALGLGEIEVRSHLNQRFDAIIPLTSVSAEEAADLRVGIAGPEDFARAGLEHSDYLSSLRFVVRAEGASPRIEVSSDKPEREPFVQMLLEVRSGGNRILRQYTALLDPPGRAQAQTPAKSSKPVAAELAAETIPVFVEVEHPEPPPDERKSVQRPASTSAPDAAASVSSELYGPVKPAETLWSIATRVRGDSDVTMDQALLALYNSNPRAFDGNFNGLKRGAMLRIPTANDMRAMDAASAHREIARLRGLRSGGTKGVAHRPQIEPVKITPPPAPAATVVEATPPNGDASAAVVSPDAANTANDAPADSAVDATAGNVDGNGDENAAEREAGDAVATDESDTDHAAAADAVASGAETEAEAEPESEAAPDPKTQDESGLFGTLLIPLLLGLLLLLVLVRLYSRWRTRRTAQSLPPATEPERVPLRTVAATVAATDVAAGQTQKLSPQEELDRLQASLSEATRDDLPAPSNTQQLDTDAAEQTQAIAADLPPVDFDLTGQFAAQTVQIDLDANDPVSEADFHLAYGLYDEAALLLRQAAEKEPERTDIGVKLAETYFAAGKVADFERTAVELKPKLEPAEWQKLAIMGLQLDPDSSLFGEAAQAPAVSTDDAAAAADPVLDFNFDVEPPVPEEAVPVTPVAADSGLDFKLDDLELPSLDLARNEAPEATSSAPIDGNALDFDLGSFDMPDTAPEVAATSEPGVEHDATASIDFDLGEFDVPDTAGTAGTPSSVDMPIEEFDFDTVSADAGDIGGDEASTKLDLARAYVEMGDHEMARGLLDEVLSQGNEQQKQDAQLLIARLA